MTLVLSRLVGPVRFDLGDLRPNAAFGFQRVIGVLQPQEIAFRQAEEFAQPQIGVARDAARANDDGVDAIAWNADRLSELVLAHADLAKKLFFQNFARMR